MAGSFILVWHAVLVHFAVGLVFTSTVFTILTKVRHSARKDFETVAKWTLWVATLVALLAWVAGSAMPPSLASYSTLQELMTSYQIWGSVTVIVLIAFAALLWMSSSMATLHVIVALPVSALVGATGFFGASLLYTQDMGAYVLAPATVVQDSRARDVTQASPQMDAGSGIENMSKAGSRLPAAAFVGRFHEAMHSGKFDFVARSFSQDATIFENGVKEPSLDIYLETHLKPEMSTLKSAKWQVLKQDIVESDSVAVVTTTSILTFSVNDKKHNFNSVETLVLISVGEQWQVKHAHWSSRPIQEQ